MDTYLRLFWFVCAAWMVFGYFVVARATRMLWRGDAEAHRVFQELLRRGTFLVVGVCVVLGVSALVTDTPSVTCTRFLEFRRANDMVATVTVLVAWGVVLWWVWLRGGARQIAEVATVIAASSGSRRRVSPRLIGLAITAVPLGILVLHLVVPPVEPVDPLCLP